MKLYTPEEMAAKKAAKIEKTLKIRQKHNDNAKAAAQRVDLNLITPARAYIFGAPETDEA